MHLYSITKCQFLTGLRSSLPIQQTLLAHRSCANCEKRNYCGIPRASWCMPSLIRACDGSDEEPEGKTKWRKKGELLDKLENGISLSAVEHDDGVKGKTNNVSSRKMKRSRDAWRLLLTRMRNFMASCRDPLPHEKDFVYLKMRHRKGCQ